LYCPHYVKVAFTITGPREALITRLRCKMWACDYCAKKNAARWRAHLVDKLVEISNAWYLVTFTAPRNKRSRQESLAAIRGNLDKFLKRLQRVFGKVQYVRVYEKHPSSEAIHAHMLVCGLSPFVVIGKNRKGKTVAFPVLNRTSYRGSWSLRTWFKKTAKACGMGEIVDVQLIQNNVQLAIFYICKYLTKAQQDLHEKGLRHVQTSRAIGSPPKGSEETWKAASYITVYTFDPGTRITDLNTGFVIDNNFWEHTGFYPNE